MVSDALDYITVKGFKRIASVERLTCAIKRGAANVLDHAMNKGAASIKLQG